MLRSSSCLYSTSSVTDTTAWMQDQLTINSIDYVVETRQFDIFETTGCQSAVYVSIPSLLMICAPQLLFFLIAMTYDICKYVILPLRRYQGLIDD